MSLNINSLLNPEKSVNHQTEVRNIWNRVFDHYLKTLPPPDSKAGALAYYGEIMIHAADALRAFKDELLDEERLNSTGHNIVDQAFRANGFNDMGILEHATKSRKMLRTMKDAVDASVTSLENIKESCASPVQQKRSLEPNPQAFFSESSSRSSFSLPASTSTAVFSAVGSQTSVSDSSRMYHSSDRDRRSTSPASPQDDDDDELNDMDMDDLDSVDNVDNVDMESLRHRGKGEYMCPYWKTCQKGGQDFNGRPKIFHRNCMYRQHIQKHSKPHKCRLPGCPNKEGFARKDQLVRHQQNVKHDQPLPLPTTRR
ncbi:hypothetical protein EsH8_II_001268 [Colletotrichum jinshuiense]